MIAFEKSVGAVVFRRRGEKTIMYLLLHYPKGHWGFPKGHVEIGETEEQTMRREVEEETGLDDLEICEGFEKVQSRYFYRAHGEERHARKKAGKFINIAKKVIFYLVETRNKNIKISSEHTGYVWLGYGDAINRLDYNNAKNLLKKAHKYLNKE